MTWQTETEIALLKNNEPLWVAFVFADDVIYNNEYYCYVNGITTKGG